MTQTDLKIISQIPTPRLLSAIKYYKEFKVRYPEVDVLEYRKEGTPLSDFEMRIKERPDLYRTVQVFKPINKQTASHIRRMKRAPKNVFAALITIGDNKEDPDEIFLYHYCDRGSEIGKEMLNRRIIDEFIKYKSFDSADDVMQFLKQWEMDSEKEYMFHEMVKHGEIEIGNRKGVNNNGI